jgi:hypothetical protein
MKENMETSPEKEKSHQQQNYSQQYDYLSAFTVSAQDYRDGTNHNDTSATNFGLCEHIFWALMNLFTIITCLMLKVLISCPITTFTGRHETTNKKQNETNEYAQHSH